MLNKGKSWLSQGICLNVVLDTFIIPKIPKKPKNLWVSRKKVCLKDCYFLRKLLYRGKNAVFILLAKRLFLFLVFRGVQNNNNNKK